MGTTSLNELHALFEKSLDHFENLTAKHDFYNALREKILQSGSQDPDASITEASMGDTSKVESERDSNYNEINKQLQKEIALEMKRTEELRAAIEQSMSEKQPKKAVNLEGLEKECAKVEKLLDTYSDSPSRLDSLKATQKNLLAEKKSLEEQIERAAAARKRNEQLRLSMKGHKAPSKETVDLLLHLLS